MSHGRVLDHWAARSVTTPARSPPGKSPSLLTVARGSHGRLPNRAIRYEIPIEVEWEREWCWKILDPTGRSL